MRETKFIEQNKEKWSKFEKILDDNKNIINENGEKYSIIHQINRCNLPFMLRLVE